MTPMFSIAGPRTVVSSTGFAVEDLGHGKGVRYTEGRRRAVIYSEYSDTRDNNIMIWPDSLFAWKGWRKKWIDEAERQRIVANVVEALAFMGVETELGRECWR